MAAERSKSNPEVSTSSFILGLEVVKEWTILIILLMDGATLEFTSLEQATFNYIPKVK